MSLHIDVESRSTIDLTKTGVYRYMADPTTDLWVVCYAFDEEPVQKWFPGDPPPAEVVEHIILGGIIFAHNANFEMQVFRYILAPRYGWPEPAIEQFRCTMAICYAQALPGALENAAPAAGLTTTKDMVGNRLMKQMMRPRRVEADGTIVWWNDPEKIARLADYCASDVEAERALEKRLRPLNDFEQSLWHLDQRINLRGVLIDEDLCRAAKQIVDASQIHLNKRMRALTNGDVSACSNRNQIVKFVRDQGIEVDSIAKAQLEELLDETNDLPPVVREVLEIRQESAKASVAKIDALLLGKSPEDGRAKGLVQYHAATTGRWGGRRFQPQNIRKPVEKDIDTLLEIVATGDFDYVSMLYDQPLSAVGDCLRGMLVAPDGHRIIAADYNAIEARVLAWLAGQNDLVDLFRSGGKVYETMASRIYGVPVAEIPKTDPRRQLGKTAVLGCGFGMGASKFQATCAKDNIVIERDMAQTVIDVYRESNSRIKQFWYDMENAAVEAVRQRGTVQSAGRIRFKVAGSFLMMRLPSGRFLAYPYPEVRDLPVPWTNKDGTPATKPGLTYFSTIDVLKKSKIVEDPKNGSQWARITTYGGSIVENATQAVARDVLADAMPRLEAAGYPIVLTVHDEIVCEVPDGHGSVEEMESIMCDLPAWAAGLPVAAEGFEGERYRK